MPTGDQVLNQRLWGTLKIQTSTYSSIAAVRKYDKSIVLDLEVRRSNFSVLARLYSLWPQGKSNSLLYFSFSELFSVAHPRKIFPMLKSREEQLQTTFFCLSLISDLLFCLTSPPHALLPFCFSYQDACIWLTQSNLSIVCHSFN